VISLGLLTACGQWPGQAAAPSRSARVGYLILSTAESNARLEEEFRTGLRALGYVEGQNLTIERRSAGEHPEQLPELVREVIALKPDVIFTPSGRVLLQIKAAGTTVPAVGSTSDPVGYGLAASLARPGGNITGISVDTGVEIFGKRLELLRELVPSAKTVAFLTPRDGWDNILGKAAKEAAVRAGLSLVGPPLDTPIGEAEYRRVFAAMMEQRPDALLVSDYGENMTHRRLIADLARVHRLPAVFIPFAPSLRTADC